MQNNSVNFDKNNIILSFAVMSDIHITQSNERDHCTFLYKNAIGTAYRLASPRTLDLVFVPGDVAQNIVYDKPEAIHEINDFKILTDRYLKPETAFVFCTGNHDRNRNKSYEKEFTDAFTAREDDVKRYYKYDVDMDSVYSYSGNRHAIVNGYHFISVGMFSDYTAYLKPILDELTEKEPLKPVFVAYHYHASNTVYATHYETDANEDKLKVLLDNYPQVVFFSGHSHSALENPRSIWQGTFTAMETSSVRFLDDNSLVNFTRKIPVNATHGEVFDYASEAQLVEVDKEGNIRFTCYNCYRGDVIATYTIPSPKADKSHLTVYTDQRREKSQLPVFNENARFTLDAIGDGKVSFEFDQAYHENIVWYYEMNFKSENENCTKLITSRYYDKHGMPYRLSGEIEGLTPENTYSVKLTPFDVWDKPGKALTLEITVK